MKNVAILLVLLFISSSLFAQFENIDLSKYKLPDIKRRQLDIKFNENFQYRNSWYKENNPILDAKINGFIEVDFNSFKNSKKIHEEIDIYFNSGLNSSSEKEKDLTYDKAKEIISRLNIGIKK